MKGPNIYFVMTKNCNYECVHCYLEAGPGQQDTTIEEKDFRKVIDHLPKVSMVLNVTGGEVFTIKNTLYSYLDYINYENGVREEEGHGIINIGLQTNGFWAVNDEITKKVLSELTHFNVTAIDITSRDSFHETQGADMVKLKRLEELIRDSKLFRYFYLRGADAYSIAPVGRGKNIGYCGDLYNYRAYCAGNLETYELTIHPSGEVYMCCFGRAKLPGNVIEEKLDQIVRKAKKNERLIMLNQGNIRELILADTGMGTTKFGCAACFSSYPDGIK